MSRRTLIVIATGIVMLAFWLGWLLAVSSPYSVFP